LFPEPFAALGIGKFRDGSGLPVFDADLYLGMAAQIQL
jgi:hypothetical protein